MLRVQGPGYGVEGLDWWIYDVGRKVFGGGFFGFVFMRWVFE